MLSEFPEAKECINWLNKDGMTPLFMSIANCRPTVVAALLKQGATLNILCQGRSALHEAMLQNKSSVKEYGTEKNINFYFYNMMSSF